ncbi:MAG: L,D-transpeptidase [Planctomycetota bacterium]
MSCKPPPKTAAPGSPGRPPTAALDESWWTGLCDLGWEDRVGRDLGLWVSVARQELLGVRDGRIVFRHPCSTAEKGVGNCRDSFQTPLGWHAVKERYGDDLPLGAIFKERKYTKKTWRPDTPTRDDLILTRIMWLRGLEPGLNSGKGVDSHARYIYIHGTPEEDKLGTPASMGCIRLSNQAVADVFDRTVAGTRVLITEW